MFLVFIGHFHLNVLNDKVRVVCQGSYFIQVGHLFSQTDKRRLRSILYGLLQQVWKLCFEPHVAWLIS